MGLQFTDRPLMNEFDRLSAPLKAEYGIRAYGWLSVRAVGYGSSSLDQVRLEYVPSLATWAGLLSEDTTYATIWSYRQDALDKNHSATVITRGSSDDNDNNVLLPNLYN